MKWNTVLLGDCLEVMRDFPDNSIDAVVTDPPYALTTTKRWKNSNQFAQSQSDVGKRFSKGFMGKEWDGQIPGVEIWSEVLRVVKPGAHMLAFGGTRTHHRLMVAIEDAGWEIRDCLMWLYGSGFPKSLDISKAIDKMKGVEREVIGIGKGTGKQNPAWNGTEAGRKENSLKPEYDLTTPATPEAQQWYGWGTALKPAWEPIILARKPLEGTVVENVLKWGTGGINVDEGRIDSIGYTKGGQNRSVAFGINGLGEKQPRCDGSQGRWPANLLLDEKVATMLDEQSGDLQDSKGEYVRKTGANQFLGLINGDERINQPSGIIDSGRASRFFYTAKADSTERNKYLAGIGQKVNDVRDTPIDNPFQRGETLRKNIHPTVKPVDLLRYLCRLITPSNGLILDPFAGSGSTGVAAHEEGFDYILIEIEPEYVKIAKLRNAQRRIIEFA